MKHFKAVLIGVAMIALAPAGAWAAPGDGLVGTAHDFSGIGSPATGLCTFCHTPHRATATNLLWNHTLSTATFTWDDTVTTAGTLYPTTTKGDTYKGPTTKCLSCHDGSVAVGDIAWFNAAKPAILDTTQHTWPDPFNVGATDGTLGNMKGNHPVAMPYPFGNVANTYNGSTTGAGAELFEWQSTPLSPIRIFNDDGLGNISAGAAAGRTGLECSSCHDPHNKAAVDERFLRGTLGGSVAGAGANYICLKCHVK